MELSCININLRLFFFGTVLLGIVSFTPCFLIFIEKIIQIFALLCFDPIDELQFPHTT